MSINMDSLKTYNIIGKSNKKQAVEKAAQKIFAVCAFLAVAAVAVITAYMIWNGTPGLYRVGLKELLFETEWKPAAAQPRYGILYIILTSVVGTALGVLIGVPLGVFTAVFLAEVAPPKVAAVGKSAVELLSGIPSVIYGLLGLMLLNPLMYRLELKLFEGSDTHQFTGGANLISAVIVLAVMILPTVTNISVAALRAVPSGLKEASLSLGATPVKTIFRVTLPAARSGIAAATVLGTGRAVGEAMAVSLVSGSSVNAPFPFHSVRFLTTAIVSEMGYAADLHRQVLFTIGLILFLFIMLLNAGLTRILKKEERIR